MGKYNLKSNSNELKLMFPNVLGELPVANVNNSRPRKQFTRRSGKSSVIEDLLTKRKRDAEIYDEAVEIPTAEAFVEEMRDAYYRDAECQLRNDPALFKIRLMPRVEKLFASKQFQKAFVQSKGCEIFSLWLSRSEGGDLPSKTLAWALVNLISGMEFELKYVKESDLGRTLQELKYLMKDLEMSARIDRIIDRWTRAAIDEATEQENGPRIPPRKVTNLSAIDNGPKTRNAGQAISIPTRSILDFRVAPTPKTVPPPAPSGKSAFVLMKRK
eukprot:TRINITY_DN5057_c0_g1_i1.p1 TRINITY_DN5057_c0_g1~~TRINITY_DN5057_c0_g1_i1.p1  ORF type:complete len:283 (-),score=57.69 TRINITY_DN5057_c0_g1_i1:642-1457(-)